MENQRGKRSVLALFALFPLAFFFSLVLTGCAPAEITVLRGGKTEAEGEILLLEYPKETARGSDATVTIEGEAGVLYAIAVHYASGVSQAKGLMPALADETGRVSWTWRVSPKVEPGEYRAAVTGGGAIVEFTLHVTS